MSRKKSLPAGESDILRFLVENEIGERLAFILMRAQSVDSEHGVDAILNSIIRLMERGFVDVYETKTFTSTPMDLNADIIKSRFQEIRRAPIECLESPHDGPELWVGATQAGEQFLTSKKTCDFDIELLQVGAGHLAPKKHQSVATGREQRHP